MPLRPERGCGPPGRTARGLSLRLAGWHVPRVSTTPRGPLGRARWHAGGTLHSVVMLHQQSEAQDLSRVHRNRAFFAEKQHWVFAQEHPDNDPNDDEFTIGSPSKSGEYWYRDPSPDDEHSSCTLENDPWYPCLSSSSFNCRCGPLAAPTPVPGESRQRACIGRPFLGHRAWAAALQRAPHRCIAAVMRAPLARAESPRPSLRAHGVLECSLTRVGGRGDPLALPRHTLVVQAHPTP